MNMFNVHDDIHTEAIFNNSGLEDQAWYYMLHSSLIYLADHEVTASLISAIDWIYVTWLVRLLYPVIVSFMLPIFLCLLLYVSALSLHVLRHRRELHGRHPLDIFAGAKRVLAMLWNGHGRIWHGYEVVGLNKLPDGPALLIYYHGVIPVDLYYLLARILLKKDRHLRCIGDNFLFKIPGFQLFMDVCCVMPGTVQSCTNIMKDGHLLAIAPGGVREALFADGYQLMWGKRVGFAKIALQTQVPVIPIFTQNCKEAFRTVGFVRSLLRKFYEKTRLPIIPIYGGLPVKLRTLIGDPIPYDPAVSAEELSLRVQSAITELINKHQRLPGSISQALMDRFRTFAR